MLLHGLRYVILFLARLVFELLDLDGRCQCIHTNGSTCIWPADVGLSVPVGFAQLGELRLANLLGSWHDSFVRTAEAGRCSEELQDCKEERHGMERPHTQDAC